MERIIKNTYQKQEKYNKKAKNTIKESSNGILINEIRIMKYILLHIYYLK